MFTAKFFHVACAMTLVGTLPSCSSSDDGPTIPSFNTAGTGGSFAGTPSGGGASGIGGASTSAGTFSESGTNTAGSLDTGGGGNAGDTAAGGGGTGGVGGSVAGAGTAAAGGSGGSAGSGGAGGATATTVTVQTTSIGSVIADQDGMTLYVFGSDTHGTPPTSACSADCLTNWPIFYQATVSVPASLMASDFTAFDRGGGTMQTAYQGWPLYHYALDNGPGETKGDGVGTWHAAKVSFTAPQ